MVNSKHNISVSPSENRTEYDKLYRIKNKERIREYNKTRLQRTRERVQDRKIYLIQYKGGKCMQCGIQLNENNWIIFDFHHVGAKDFNMAPFTRNMVDLKKEADKCILVCANCHRMIHASE